MDSSGIPPRAIDWDDLKFFLALARHGTLTAAARALQVTQPTVGRRIAAFEERLGAKLFTVTPNRHDLSATGRLLVAHAERMESEALSAERVAGGRDAGIDGRVTITGSEWVVETILGKIVEALVSRHPALELVVRGEARHLNLVRREADIAIRPARFEHQDLIEMAVGSVSFGLYASDAYLEKHGAPDFAEGCVRHRLVAMPEELTRIPDIEWLSRIAGRARVCAHVPGRTAIAALVASGVGMGCLPRILGDAHPSLRLLSTPSPRPERQLWLATHRDTRAVPRIRSTLSALKDGMRRLRPSLHPED